MAQPKTDPRVTKRRVTMRNFSVGVDEEGRRFVATHEATDYVNPEFLDAYVADARTRWEEVEVSEEPDAGPGGYHGETNVPADLDHELAGEHRPATSDEDED